MKLPRSRMALIGTGAALALAIGVAIPVMALTRSSPVTYYACVTTRTGALKIVSKSARCGTGQHKISWNNIGPRGPAGPPGPRGPRGPAGVVTSYIDQPSPGTSLNNGTDTVVATLNLPSGSFQLSADVGVDLVDTSTPDTVSCSMLDGNNNVIDDQYDDYTLNGELTLLGDTTVGGTVIVQCFDFANNADTTSVTLQAIPVSSVQAVPRGGNARHLRLPVPPGHLRPARHR